MYSFHCELGLGYMTVPEMLEMMHKNNLFDMFLVFSYVVHILGVIPATFCSTEQSFSALRRLKLISAAPYTECKYGGPLGRPGTSSMEARPVSM